jgi:hypothetical protein
MLRTIIATLLFGAALSAQIITSYQIPCPAPKGGTDGFACVNGAAIQTTDPILTNGLKESAAMDESAAVTPKPIDNPAKTSATAFLAFNLLDKTCDPNCSPFAVQNSPCVQFSWLAWNSSSVAAEADSVKACFVPAITSVADNLRLIDLTPAITNSRFEVSENSRVFFTIEGNGSITDGKGHDLIDKDGHMLCRPDEFKAIMQRVAKGTGASK